MNETAKDLIVKFAVNQSAITKATNTGRGKVSQKLRREESKLVWKLLQAITGRDPRIDDVKEVVERLG
jgi:hypothetical protein